MEERSQVKGIKSSSSPARNKTSSTKPILIFHTNHPKQKTLPLQSTFQLPPTTTIKMQFTTLTAASILALASSALAGNAIVQNNCPQQVYLTITRQDQSSSQQTLAANGGHFSEALQGQGNSYGVSKNSDYYSANTPKLIWGASDSAGLVYYSLSTANGNPFDGQSVNLKGSDAACPVVSSPDGSVKACADSSDFTLTLC